ncbi:LAMI_0G10770g1_1 [Lachancea mirantina]|uniref:LAMI_0G10770g1_1 n=1 Tax=Lachancea mirantina TaxID=1230905 RepID=A0A1G4KAS2_9SACH|nr:LAMI_0G10770g1_1 [Lachancea mirantina]
MNQDYLDATFDPKEVKVAQLRRILIENGVVIRSGMKKADLCELFEDNIRSQREKLLKDREGGSGPDVFESSISVETSSVGSPAKFSDENDFQGDRKTNSRRKRKRDKDDESRSRKRKVSSVKGSPIVEKVHKKSPVKSSPHKSLVIDKFESSSSSSSSSPAASPLSSPSHHPSNVVEDIADFSFKRRALSPDLSKLKVSPAFAEQLKRASSRARSADNGSRSSTFLDKTFSSSDSKSVAEWESSRVEKSLTESDTSAQESDKEEQVSMDKSSGTEVEADDKEETIESSEAEDNEDSILVEVQQPSSSSEDNSTHQQVDLSATIVEEEVSHGRIFRGVLWSALICLLKKFQKLVIYYLMLFTLFFGLWYREERVRVGYCGHEVNLPTFQNPNNSAWLEDFENILAKHKPYCLPCPENAICYPYMKIKCRPGYVVTNSKASLFGLFPISDYCAKDSKKERMINEVVKKSLELLRTKNAQLDCGEGVDDVQSGMNEKELYSIFSESRAPWINNEEFDDLWVQVIEDLKNEPEITWRQTPTNDFKVPGSREHATAAHDFQGTQADFPNGQKNGYFRSTSKKYISLRCKFEREVYQTYQRYKLIVWSLVLISTFVQVIKHKLRQHFKMIRKLDTLAQDILERLQKAARESDDTRPAFMSTVQLRDILLSDIVDLKQKNKIWQRVAKKLEHNNTNVKVTLMELHGEIMKCWEWIGPVDEKL